MKTSIFFIISQIIARNANEQIFLAFIFVFIFLLKFIKNEERDEKRKKYMYNFQ